MAALRSRDSAAVYESRRVGRALLASRASAAASRPAARGRPVTGPGRAEPDVTAVILTHDADPDTLRDCLALRRPPGPARADNRSSDEGSSSSAALARVAIASA